jgi:gamma-glutamyltranspeptidase/glutathione hydrolase
VQSAAGLAKFPASKAAFLKPDGTAHAPGETVRQPDLARTYRAIAERGPEWFYQGEFARTLDAHLREVGGIMTAEDLARYRVVEREPVRSTYRGYEIIGMPPPSSGGVHVGQILNVLEHFDLPKLSAVDRAHVIAEAMKLAFADRAFWLGDPDFARVPRGPARPGLRRRARQAHRPGQGDEGRAPRRAAERDDGRLRPAAHDARRRRRRRRQLRRDDADGERPLRVARRRAGHGRRAEQPDGRLLHPAGRAQPVQARRRGGQRGGAREAAAVQHEPDHRAADGKPVMTLGAAGGPRIITQVLLGIVNRID